MENPFIVQLRDGIRYTETGPGESEQARAKKRCEVRTRRRPCEILSNKKRKERKQCNAAPIN